MKKTIIIISIIIIIFCFFRLKISPDFHLIDEDKSINKETFTQDYLEQEELCLEFVKQNLSSKSGCIYTNYLQNSKVEEMASGHEILSESEGLIMLYYVKAKEKDEFDKHFNIVKSKMLDKTGLIKWRVKEDHDMGITNATIDDLRIIRALIHAYEIWKDKEYYEVLKKINKGLLKYNIYKGCINNHYDMEGKHKSKQIDAAYIDLYTIKLLTNTDNKWNEIYDNALKVIEEGYLSDNFPLYRKTYDIEQVAYLDSEVINSIDTLLVVLHLSEVGLVKNETIDWIKKQIIDGEGIYAQYNIKTGEPVDEIQSTATYAIAGRIAQNIGDATLYKALIDKMITLQVVDKSSSIYGSFGDINTLKVYSFDNLQALLAFRF